MMDSVRMQYYSGATDICQTVNVIGSITLCKYFVLDKRTPTGEPEQVGNADESPGLRS